MHLDAGLTLAGEPLHPKPGAAEDSGAQALLESDRELDPHSRAHEAMPMDHVAVARGDVKGQDLTWKLARERQQSGAADGRVLGHEKRASGHRPAERAQESALLSAHRRSR